MKTVSKVVVFGWYGAGNVGDELLLASFIDWAKERGCTVTAISIDPEYTRAAHSVDAVDFNDYSAVSSAMVDADLFALGGGGLLQTHNAFTFSALYDFDSTADVSTYARMVLLAKQFGLKTLLWAQGVGPLDGEQARKIVSGLVSVVDAISVRDEASSATLRALGAKQTIACAPDPIWGARLTFPDAHVESASKRIGLVIRPWGLDSQWCGRLAESLLLALGHNGYTLVWIPYQARSVPARSDSDLAVINECIAKIGDAFEHEIAQVQTTGDALSAMAGCAGLVSMRLHAQILGARLGLPMLSIEYDVKMSHNAKIAGFADSCRLLVDASPEMWNQAVEDFARAVVGNVPAADPASVLELSRRALVHRDVLWDALQEAPAGLRTWTPGAFDWAGSWQAHTTRRIIESQAEFIRNLAIKGQDQLDGLLASHRLASEAQGAAIEALAVELERKQQLADQRQEQIDQQQARIDELLAGISRVAMLAQNGRGVDAEGEQALAQVALMLSERGLIERDQVREQLKSLKAESYAIHRELNSEKVRAENSELVAVRLRNELQAVRHSSSWKVTRPLRSLARFLRNPHQEMSLLREWFAGINKTVAEAREMGGAGSTDLSWEQFRESVLVNRGRYKGVFIQEVVIDWQVPLYQRPQHVSAAMAKLGYLVIYRTVNWAGDDVQGFREVLPNVWLTNLDEADSIDGAVRSVYSTAYAKSPERFSEIGKGNVMMYEYIDHIDPQISGDEENIRRLLQQKSWAFGGGADVVVASANALFEEAVQAVGASKVIAAKNGVDTEHYRAEKHVSYALPSVLSEFKRRHSLILGYFGALAPWLWYDGIAELVARRKDIGFVFIGPDYYGGADRLPQADNVLYMGAIDYRVLPAYARSFDVCFIPFEKGEIARTTSPLKLFEYFALEKPVVVTAWMDECVAHPEVFRGDTVDALERAIDAAALAKDDPVLRRRYAEMADENSWYSRAEAMAEAFKLLDRN